MRFTRPAQQLKRGIVPGGGVALSPLFLEALDKMKLNGRRADRGVKYYQEVP